MRDRGLRALALSVIVMGLVRPTDVIAQEKPADPPKKVLVELYTSQGCNSCPPASELMGKLSALGYGPDRIVPINFHVDYFNEPWADPFSDPSYSRRQRSYGEVLGRNDLYFTPLMMVDGREPLLGSDRPKALATLREALKEPPGVLLDLNLDGAGTRKILSVKLASRSPVVAGRDLLIGIALTEDPVTTKVPKGENAGRTLVEHHVVRRFEHKFTKLDKTESRTLNFPIDLPSSKDAARFRVTVFAQDRVSGKVYQADSVPWIIPKTTKASIDHAHALKRMVARRKARTNATDRLLGLSGLGSFMAATDSNSTTSNDTVTECPACGSPFTPPPARAIVRRPGQPIVPPVVTC